MVTGVQTCALPIYSSHGGVTHVVLEENGGEVVRRPPLEVLLETYELSSDTFLQHLQRAHREESVKRIKKRDGEIIIQPIVGVQPVIVFGGGHVGRSISKIASAAGFVVTIVDDREQYAAQGRFPDAVRTLAENWDAAFTLLPIRSATSIVIVTRGHESDAEVLRHAVTTPARYIGMIGSRKKVAATYKKLVDAGIPRSLLERVHAPIGLEIGATTAEEIAVSIVAELIRTRRGFQGISEPLSGRMKLWFDQPGS
jgi:xanthine dehydrogenase accessory factor